jgi:hypothetical protein
VRIRILTAGLAIAAAAFLGAPASQATPFPPGTTFSINGWNPGGTALGCSTDGDVTNCSGSNAGPSNGNFTVTSWNLHLDTDPTVVNFFALQNNLNVAQTFTITVLIPISTFGPPITVQGSIGGSITDANGNGVQLTSSAPTAIYTALINGSSVQTLLNDPQNYTAGSFGSQTFGPASFGPTSLGITATSTIGIQVKFTLSPGDLASYTSVFTVVPEPATLALVIAGLAGVAHFGRRRA